MGETQENWGASSISPSHHLKYYYNERQKTMVGVDGRGVDSQLRL